MQNIFIRAILLYLACLIAMRIMGKRQIGQLQPFELVITILVAQLAASPMADAGIPLIYGFVPLFAILFIHQIISFIMMRSSHARGIICGKPSILIQKGKVQEKEMHEQLLNMEDLIARLRIDGYFRIQDIETAMLESNGQLSVLPVASQKTVTPSDLKIKVDQVSMPISLIIDGRIYHENLTLIKQDIIWLDKQLASEKLKPRDILFALYYPETKELHIQSKKKRKKVGIRG